MIFLVELRETEVIDSNASGILRNGMTQGLKDSFWLKC